MQKATVKSPAKRGRKPKAAVTATDSLADAPAAASPKKRKSRAKAAAKPAADRLVKSPVDDPEFHDRATSHAGVGDVASVTSPAKRRGRPPGSRNKKKVAAEEPIKPGCKEVLLERVRDTGTCGRIIAAAAVDVVDVSDSDDEGGEMLSDSFKAQSVACSPPEHDLHSAEQCSSRADSISPADLCSASPQALRERLAQWTAGQVGQPLASELPGCSPGVEDDGGNLGLSPLASPSPSPPSNEILLPGCETPSEIRGLQRDVGSMGLGCVDPSSRVEEAEAVACGFGPADGRREDGAVNDSDSRREPLASEVTGVIARPKRIRFALVDYEFKLKGVKLALECIRWSS